jgi:peptidoglycan/LPS O-acetylase OafA/YrhL
LASDDRFVTLDGMRGLAAVIVALAHIGELLGFGILPHAHLAVDFFFVLSGFVIGHAYDQRLVTSMNPLQFLERRLIRLHPLIVLATAISAVTLIVGGSGASGPGMAAILGAFLAGCLLIPIHPLSSPWAFPLNGPAWSLFAEYWVNILFAFTAPWLTQRRLRGVIALSFGMLLALFGIAGNVWNLWLSSSITLSLFRVMYPFFVGLFLSRVFRSSRHDLPAVSPLVSVSILAAILLSPGIGFEVLFDFAMIAIAFPLLVIASARDRANPMERDFLLLGGRLSYPIYTLHFPLMLLLSQGIIGPVLPWRNVGTLVVSLLLVIAVSYLILRYVDEPLRAWLGARRPPPQIRSVAT